MVGVWRVTMSRVAIFEVKVQISSGREEEEAHLLTQVTIYNQGTPADFQKIDLFWHVHT